MRLSIVIVSHNSLPFLRYCLDAAFLAMEGIEGEVVLVDNDSVDATAMSMQKEFPALKIIANKQNLGFGKACNQGWKITWGEMVLFLNPDCIISQDALEQCIEFLEAHPDAGSVGVQMINGKGEFLPESKRGIPDPMAGFYKLTGLAALFPASGRLNAYYETSVKPGTVNAVPVLSGAYMMVRRTVLEQTGGFDERYFMYAEDIDLSISIQKAGFQNVYLGSATVLHFKGTSTPKDKIYTRHFYKAMRLFVKKYWSNPFKKMVLLTGIAVREKWEGFRIKMEIKKNTNTSIADWYLEGDPSAIDAARKTLEKDPRNILRAAPVKGCTILLCIGRNFGYAEVIRLMKENNGFRYKLYKPLLANIIG